MKTINAKLYAIKYKLKKMLEASITKDNEAIKNGAKITFENYCKIQVIECTRTSYTKEQQAILDKYAQKQGFTKQVTTYARIDIDNIPAEVDDKVSQILDTLEDDNDKTVARVASAVAKR